MMKSHRWRRALRCLGLTAAVGLWLFLLAPAALFFPHQVLNRDSGEVHADVLVVLGGGMRERPERAAELFHAGAAPRVLCTGFGDDRLNRACLISHGVPADVITLESESRSTRDNARFSLPLLRALGARRIIIVTSWYHSRRALACFEHYAPDLTFYSRPTYYGYPPAEWGQHGIRDYIKAEYVKMLGYWLCYGIGPL